MNVYVSWYRHIICSYLLLFLYSPPSRADTGSCFDITGVRGDGGNIVCFPDQKFSLCCGFGWACLENKLCERTPAAPNGNGPLLSRFARGTCTDPTWGPDCPQFCNNTVQDAGGLTQCDPSANTWCCNPQGNTEPCDCDTDSFVLSGSLSVITTAGITASSTSSSISTGTSSKSTRTSRNMESSTTGSSKPATSIQTTSLIPVIASSHPTVIASDTSPIPISTPMSKDKSLSIPAKAGLGVGIPAIALVVGVSFFLYRQQRQKTQYLEGQLASAHNQVNLLTNIEHPSYVKHELSSVHASTAARSELDSGDRISNMGWYEMDARPP